MYEINPRLFKIFALSLENGLDFGDHVPVSSWMSECHQACGLILYCEKNSAHLFFTMRRREDGIWVVVERQEGVKGHSLAKTLLGRSMRNGDSKEPIPSGVRKRKILHDLEGRDASNLFKLLGSPSHYSAAWTLNQVYLAMPNPDPNFVSDFQTTNFHTRLWELYLLACFREQGLQVTQEHRSPDFLIARNEREAWVEAVTANPETPYEHVNAVPTFAPVDPVERQIGKTAFRYAKTIRSKLQRNYHKMAHVAGKPFAIAVADFHKPGSMVWSREALPCYLYGIAGVVVEEKGKKFTKEELVEKLQLDIDIPAGLFRDPQYRHLSAVLHSNAGTIAKFNRMGFLSGHQYPGLRMIRRGHFYDRTPGALCGIDFDLDISGEEYNSLWPHGEEWSLELEIYHNPLASFPFALDLLPFATHWFEQDGEVICSSRYKHTILASITELKMEENSDS